MKSLYKCVLKEYLTECFTNTRRESGLTQQAFSEKLMMDIRSYASLEHGENLCCTLTFILFLCFYCKDPETMIRDLRCILAKYRNEEKPVS
ncbi:MAG: hypothetical protein E7441_12235 [Ruminococcaceae bacterium]|nr:hypothetical protein [Oscillospiraceae bacterium]